MFHMVISKTRLTAITLLLWHIVHGTAHFLAPIIAGQMMRPHALHQDFIFRQ
jgi:hypothetical protein